MDLSNYSSTPFTTKGANEGIAATGARGVTSFWHLRALFMIFMRFFPRRDTVSRISVGTAYSALFLTGLALVLGPWNVLRRQFNPSEF